MFIEISLFVIFVFLVYYYFKDKTREKLPPGEWGLPIVGVLLGKEERITDFILRFRKKYGDLFTVKMGSRLMVFVCDYSTVKTLFNKREFSGRPNYFTYLVFRKYQKKGIMMSEGSLWNTNRRFALRVLKDFGLGKSSIADAISFEVNNLIDFFKSKNGAPMNIDCSLNVVVLNVIMKLTTNRRFGIDDPKVKGFVNMMNEAILASDGTIELLNYYPFLEDIFPKFVLNWFMRIDDLENKTNIILEYFQDIVTDHKETLNESSPRDYIDMYMIEAEKERKKPDSDYKDDKYFDLICSLLDLFMGGSETNSSTIRWYCLYICKHPEIQRKIHDEIDSVVPSDRLPSLDDKKKLPFTEASIYELHRIISLLPMGILHTALEEAQIGKYTIPKGTIIAGPIDVCHKNPKYWKKPNEFYPEHFLDDNGQFRVPKEGFMPFSVGRRQCPGESLAKMELFLFLSAILHTFEIQEPEGQNISLEIDPISKIFNLSQSQELVFKLRN